LQKGAWDEASIWLSGQSGKPAASASAYSVSVNTGFHRVGTKNSWVLIRAGRYTRRPFQADQLHVDLWWRGINLARDAGTYLYNGEAPWNNGLAGTAVHNTVMVDGKDQMRRAGRFLWLDWAQASGKVFSNGAKDCPNAFEGEHDGYRNLGVKHRRRVECVSEDGWIIVDDLQGAGQHELRLHWLLADLPFEVVSTSPFCAVLSTDKARFRFSVFSSAPGNGAVVRGGKCLDGDLGGDHQLLGWESPTYGELRPAISVVYNVRGLLPVRIVTAVIVNEAMQLRQDDHELVLSRDQSQVWQVSLTPQESASVST
jgi:hypothetical protein